MIPATLVLSAHRRLELTYPDGSATHGAETAFVAGVSEVRIGERGLIVQTFADVHLDDEFDDGRFYAERLREAAGDAIDALERAGETHKAGELREAVTLAGFPPRPPIPGFGG